MEPRRIDLDSLLRAHAFMRVERPPELWKVDVLDEPFVRMLGELIVVGLRHHDVLGELTLNASNVSVEGDPPDGVAPGDYVGVTVAGPAVGSATPRGHRPRPSRSGAAIWTSRCGRRPSPSRTCGRSAPTAARSRCGSRDRGPPD